MFAHLWRSEVDEKMSSNPDFVSGLYASLSRLNDAGEPSATLDDVISQPWGQTRRDWYDAAAQIEVGLHLQAGWCVVTAINIDNLPGRDRDQKGNQRKLDALPAPFSAWCETGSEDQDGWLSWDEEITVAHRMDGDAQLVVQYPPSSVPLEIGHTEPETTIWHLRRDGGVARWPYGARYITLLLRTVETTSRGVPLAMPKHIEGKPLVDPPERPSPPIWIDVERT
jgi:hypothetical protein